MDFLRSVGRFLVEAGGKLGGAAKTTPEKPGFSEGQVAVETAGEDLLVDRDGNPMKWSEAKSGQESPKDVLDKAKEQFAKYQGQEVDEATLTAIRSQLEVFVQAHNTAGSEDSFQESATGMNQPVCSVTHQGKKIKFAVFAASQPSGLKVSFDEW